jgi:hypothetical protein
MLLAILPIAAKDVFPANIDAPAISIFTNHCMCCVWSRHFRSPRQSKGAVGAPAARAKPPFCELHPRGAARTYMVRWQAPGDQNLMQLAPLSR